MVKGVSRQVILMDAPDHQLFEQAIFIVKDGRKEFSDEALLREARRIAGSTREGSKNVMILYLLLGAIIGAALVGVAWVLTAMYL